MDRIIDTDKIALLFPDRDLELIGKWVEDNGYFHSNTGYKSYTFDRGGISTRNSYDWDNYP